jgi:predicted Rossmann fold flavoprotein
MSLKVLVIGGGAAGYFAAINVAESRLDAEVVICEATNKVLSKVLISGGGRCNVTNDTKDPRDLVKNYPRGGRELLGPFNRFGVVETIKWFQDRGVQLKVEKDGRMFPQSNSSSTIIECFKGLVSKYKIDLRLKERIESVEFNSNFKVKAGSREEEFDAVILASGGNERSYEIARSLGHSIVSPIPSLFTFEIKDPLLDNLSGLSFLKVELSLTFSKRKFKNQGPLLITHWGLSGPAVIVLSSICARELYDANYEAELRVNFLPEMNSEEVQDLLSSYRQLNLNKKVINGLPFPLTRAFWERVLTISGIEVDLLWQGMSKKLIKDLANALTNTSLRVNGKGVFKEEFVTAGGVSLKEVDFKTMQSRICPGLYFAGEVLDIDGVTGGFNFQSAWTTAWIASQSIAYSMTP